MLSRKFFLFDTSILINIRRLRRCRIYRLTSGEEEEMFGGVTSTRGAGFAFAGTHKPKRENV